MRTARILTSVKWSEGRNGAQRAAVTWETDGSGHTEHHTFDDPAAARSFKAALDIIIQMQKAK